MNETRAVARLPGVDMEITRRRLSDNAEQLQITVQARPGFDALATFAPQRLWWWPPVASMLLWQQAMRAFWAPWLPAPRDLPGPSATPAGSERQGGANVHPFPGAHERDD